MSMELQELRGQSAVDLRTLLATSQEELRALRFRLAVGEEKNVRAVRKVRTLIARIHSVLSAQHTA